MRFAVFQAFFPHLVAGPIVRAGELLPQLEKPRDPRRVDTGRAFFLIVTGLFLKVVIANHLATHVVDDVFAAPNRHSSLEVLVGVYGYAVQIFADFCGYTNIAIGIALLLGFEFPQNFASPYTAVSLQDFWRRWHMTLSRFLRDYLYIPLGGNRKGRILTYRNLLLTMLLGGLWHGAAWTFVVWGGIHGLGLAVERATGWRPHTRAQEWFGRVLTFHVVCFAWIFFRADSFSRAGDVIVRLFSAWGQSSPLVTTSVVLAIAVGIVSQYIRPTAVTSLVGSFQRLPVVAQSACVAVALTLINTLGPTGSRPSSTSASDVCRLQRDRHPRARAVSRGAAPGGGAAQAGRDPAVRVPARRRAARHEAARLVLARASPDDAATRAAGRDRTWGRGPDRHAGAPQSATAGDDAACVAQTEAEADAAGEAALHRCAPAARLGRRRFAGAGPGRRARAHRRRSRRRRRREQVVDGPCAHRPLQLVHAHPAGASAASP